MSKKKIVLIAGVILVVALLFIFGGKEEKKTEEKQPVKVEEKKPENKEVEKPVKKELTFQEKREEKISLKGSEIFRKYNCDRCHSVTGIKVGPPLEEIASAYKGRKDELIAFLRGERPAKLGEKMGESAHLMNLQLAAIKELSDEELSELADYILSFAK